MKKLALILAAVAVVAAAPAAASAKERPEWSDCSITSLPKRYSMDKALKRGIPVSYTCTSDVTVFIPVRFNDFVINETLTVDQQMTAIAATKDRRVTAGETVRDTIRIGRGWPRRVMRRFPYARLLVDIAVDRGEGSFSHPRNARRMQLRR